MENSKRDRIHALFVPAASNHNEALQAIYLADAVRHDNLNAYEDFRREYKVGKIAQVLADKNGRKANSHDLYTANAILDKSHSERTASDKRLDDRARAAFKRFRDKHDIGSLETRGGPHAPSPRPVRQRVLRKEAQAIVDCSAPVERRYKAQKYLRDHVGRALALIDELEAKPRRKSDKSLACAKSALEQALFEFDQ